MRLLLDTCAFLWLATEPSRQLVNIHKQQNR